MMTLGHAGRGLLDSILNILQTVSKLIGSLFNLSFIFLHLLQCSGVQCRGPVCRSARPAVLDHYRGHVNQAVCIQFGRPGCGKCDTESCLGGGCNSVS